MVFNRSIVWYIVFFMILGGCLFQVKYTVLDLENTHRSLRRLILQKYEEIHMLNAEWAYLNDPARLQALSNKYLHLKPIRGDQIVAYIDLQNSGLGEYDRVRLNDLLAHPEKNQLEIHKQSSLGNKVIE